MNKDLNTGAKIFSLIASSERKNACILLGLMGIGMLMETLGVGLVLPAIMLLTTEDLPASYPAAQPLFEVAGHPSQQALIVTGMLLLTGIYLIKATFLAYLVWRQTQFAYGVKAHFSQRLFATYLRQPYTFHLQRNSAELIRNITSEVGILGSTLMSTMMFMTEGLVLLGIATLLLVVEPMGALLVAGVFGAAAWAFSHNTRARIARWGRERQYHEGLRIQHLQQGLGGVKDVKLLGRESDFLAQFDTHNSKSTRMLRLSQTLQELPRLGLELMAVVGLTLLVLTMLAQGTEVDAILPTLGLFAAAAFRLMPSVNRMLVALQALRFGLPVINTLHDELKLETSTSEVKLVKDVTPMSQDLRITQLQYTYVNASTPAIDGLSVCIKKDETVGFIGPSGSGKSTLIDVILGLLVPDLGVIEVDGRDIHQNLLMWHDQVGYVPQSIYLTDDTLRKNVSFGLPDADIDDASVQKALKLAQLEELVGSLPDGAETCVGERGIRLSGGQRQRIGIARALYHDPAVLVLDEATSSLDTATETDVMQAIMSLRGNKTILIVAHRLSTVAHCDRLYRLDYGRLVQEGTPHTMLQQPRESIA